MSRTTSTAGPAPAESPPATALDVSAAFAVAFFLSFLLLTAFAGLGSTDVVTMEGIVADGARYMARTGELAVPRLHGEIYSYKPPLAYWLALASFTLFGAENEWTLRLPFALCGVLMGLAVLWLVARRLGGHAGAITALASTTGVLTLQKMRLAEFDIPLAAGVGVAVVAACRALVDDRPPPWLWPLAYAGLAGGFLAKGVPALMLYGPGLLVAAWALGRFRRLWSPAHLAGVAVFAVVVGAWVLAAYAAEGAAAFAQPLAEGRDRGLVWTAEAFGRTLLKPLVAIGLFFPWSLAIPLAAPAVLRRDRAEPAVGMFRAALAFTIAGLATLMIVPSDETRYFLPLAVPIGIAAGIGVLYLRPRASARWVLAAFGWLAAAATLVIASGWGGVEISPVRGLLIVATGVLAVVMVERLRSGAADSTLPLLSSLVLVAFSIHVLATEPHRASSRGLRGAAELFERHLAPGEAVWTLPVSSGFRHSSLLFYLDREVRTAGTETFGAPPPGARVILFSDEPPWLDQPLPFLFRELARTPWRGGEFALLEVTGEP